MSYFQVLTSHQHWWLAGGYDLENGTFLEVASMVVTRWIVTFCAVYTVSNQMHCIRVQ